MDLSDLVSQPAGGVTAESIGVDPGCGAGYYAVLDASTGFWDCIPIQSNQSQSQSQSQSVILLLLAVGAGWWLYRKYYGKGRSSGTSGASQSEGAEDV